MCSGGREQGLGKTLIVWYVCGEGGGYEVCGGEMKCVGGDDVCGGR